ncbi:unnamed protein product [Meloidogyne enterolobii]|uniref:Uncharacterized protein n=1 Tax=Meloidogyne enterolobii TaxID=390850 RepID=A0ACB0XUK3_MELEN
MVNCLSMNHKCFGTQCCKPTSPGTGGPGTCPVWTKVDGSESIFNIYYRGFRFFKGGKLTREKLTREKLTKGGVTLKMKKF